MSEPVANGTTANGHVRSQIHLVLQGKGGIGKSVVASWLAEYLIKRRSEERRVGKECRL